MELRDGTIQRGDSLYRHSHTRSSLLRLLSRSPPRQSALLPSPPSSRAPVRRVSFMAQTKERIIIDVTHDEWEVTSIYDVDDSLSKWPRILRVHALAAARNGGGCKEKNIAVSDCICAACDGTVLGSLSLRAQELVPLYFRCAECSKPVHSPIVCPCVIPSKDEGSVFCSTECKDAREHSRPLRPRCARRRLLVDDTFG